MPNKKTTDGMNKGSIYVQSEPHFIHNALQGAHYYTPPGSLVPFPEYYYVRRGSCICYFYKYWMAAETTHINGQTQERKTFKNRYNFGNDLWYRFDYKPGEADLAQDRRTYYAIKLLLDNTENTSLDIPEWSQHNYSKLLSNYYFPSDFSAWALGDSTNPAYFVAGVNNNLYVMKFSETAFRRSISTFDDSGTTAGSGEAAIYNPSQRNVYDFSWYSFKNHGGSDPHQTSDAIAYWLHKIPQLVNEPECELFIIGVPDSSPFQLSPQFTNAQLENIVRMMCNVSDGDFEYTSIQTFNVY